MVVMTSYCVYYGDAMSFSTDISSLAVRIIGAQQRGFTLLEMVLVLFLVALMASATLLLTEGVEDQAKYDETQRRMQTIRHAIVGDATRTINGEPAISGFVADMGRLPECLNELLEARNCADDEDLNLSAETSGGFWAGWNGPYLQVLPERDGGLHLRDGYGNVNPDSALDFENSGWFFLQNLESVELSSDGFDQNENNDDITDNQLVTAADHQLVLGSSWSSIDVRLVNNSNTPLTINADELRVRLNYPQQGILPDWNDSSLDTLTERELSPFLSDTFPATTLEMDADSLNFSVASGESISISPNAVLSGSDLTLTAGNVITYTNGSGGQTEFTISSSCSPDCVMTVPAHSEADGTTTTVSFTATDEFSLDRENVDFFTLDNLAKPLITVPFSSSLASDTVTLPNGATLSLPAGSSDIIGQRIVLAGDTITVSESFVLSGTTVTTDTSADVFVVPAGTIDSGNTLTIPESIPVPIGVRSLAIVCENDGTLFSGDCTSPTLSTPSMHMIKIVARAARPIQPQPLEWVIQ